MAHLLDNALPFLHQSPWSTKKLSSGLVSCSKNPDEDLQGEYITGIVTSQFKKLAIREEQEMSKMKEMLNDLLGLNRKDLELLINEATRLFRSMRKIRIKRIFKRCGKPGCTCEKGELTDYGHGPYLYAIWSEDGKARQMSLGRAFHERELETMANAVPPVWFDKRFLVSQKQYDALKPQRRWSCKEWSLTDAEFLTFYNIPPHEDNVGRPRKLRYDKDKYDTEFSRTRDKHEISFSEFRRYGVGTLRGVFLLRSMLARGFYLVEKTDGENDA